MKNKISILALSGLTTLTAVAQNYPQKPNIIVVLVDDLGYSDFSCFGGVIPTPNIDALANQGIRMSQMYNCARSCPTRASLLTGLYPQQAGVGYMTGDLSKATGSKAYQGFINKTSVTLAEVLSDNGYFTCMTGKWHVGQKDGVTPSTKGFQQSLHAAAGGFYFSNDEKSQLFLNNEPISNDDVRLPKNWYSTDLWTKVGLGFIENAISQKRPFLWYLAYNAPHFPLQAPEEDIAKFKGKFSKGWDVLRKEIYERQMKMNLLGKKYPLSKRNPKIPLWNDVDAAQKAKSERAIEIYAACVKKVDDNIGDLVKQLKIKGVFNNTMIVILSDNGGNAEGNNVFGTFKGDNPGDVNSSVYVGQAWAEMSDTPFYLYKHHTHEGGISTPCVVSFPNAIPEKMNGKIIHEPSHVIDIMATVVAVSGAKYPEKYNGNTITPMQGINMLPAYAGKMVNRSKPIFWEHEGNVALRDGKWKIVKEILEPEFQLYDMNIDRTEMNDLKNKNPDEYNRVKALFDGKYEEVGAKPLKERALRWFVPVKEY